MRFKTIGTLLCAGLLTSTAPAHALSILPSFLSATTGPDNDVNAGAGNIQSIFAAAAEIWERAILDDGTVTIPFGWTPGSSGLAFTDGTSIFVSRDNDWFVDPTPLLNEEYASSTTGTASIGSFSVNYNVGFAGAAGAADGFDLLSVMLHEIGHVLSFGPNAFTEWADSEVNVAPPLPLAGLALPMHSRCCHIDSPAGYTGPPPLLFPFFDVQERRLISDADLLFVAQSGGWRQLDQLRFRAVPEPGMLTLSVIGAGLFWRRRVT